MKREKDYFHCVLVAIGVFTLLFTVAWYFNELDQAKDVAKKQVSSFQEFCNAQTQFKSGCELEQEYVGRVYESLCNEETKKVYETWSAVIEKSSNLFEVKELLRTEQSTALESLRGEITAGEFTEGFDYYVRIGALKEHALENIEAVNFKQCISYKTPLKNYAYCDLKYAKTFLKKNQNQVSVDFIKKAEDSYNSDDYLAAVQYTTAAIAYQDKSSREGYEDLIEAGENGLVC